MENGVGNHSDSDSAGGGDEENQRDSHADRGAHAGAGVGGGDVGLGMDEDEVFSAEEIQSAMHRDPPLDPPSAPPPSAIHSRAAAAAPSRGRVFAPRAPKSGGAVWGGGGSRYRRAARRGPDPDDDAAQNVELATLLRVDDTSFCRFHPHELAPYQCVRCEARFCLECATQFWRESHPDEARALRDAAAASAPRPSVCAECGVRGCQEHACASRRERGGREEMAVMTLRCPVCARSASWRAQQRVANCVVALLVLAILAACGALVWVLVVRP